MLIHSQTRTWHDKNIQFHISLAEIISLKFDIRFFQDFSQNFLLFQEDFECMESLYSEPLSAKENKIDIAKI